MSRRPTVPLAPRVPGDLRPASSADDSWPEGSWPEGSWIGCEVRGHAGLASRPDEISESRIVDVRLDAVDADRLHVTDAIFDACSMAGMSLLDASFERVELRGCRLSGVQLAGARLRDVRFVDCKLDDANFRMVTGERLEFAGCVLTAADFYAARVVASRFFDCDLTGADVSHADLTGARFHGSRVDGLIGAEQLRGIVIDTTQILPLALRVFGALEIVVDDEREPEK